MMKKVFLGALALLASATLAAQEQSSSMPQKLELTLDEAIEIALNDNPMIKVADMEIERQDYLRKETVSSLYPSLSGSGQYSYAIVKQTMSRSGLSFGADNTITIGANLSVPLFVPAVYASMKLNDAQIEDAIESARASKIDMVNQVKKAYYNILLLEESLNVLYESEKLLQETVDNTKAMYEAQLSSEYDYISAEVNLSNLQPTIIQTRGSIEIARMMMRMLLSLPQDIEIHVTGSLDDYSAEIENNTGTYSLDISANSDIRSLEIQEKMLESQLKVINAQRMPTIAAFGQISLYGNDMGDIDFSSASGSTGDSNINLGDYPGLSPLVNMLGVSGMTDFGRLMQDLMMGGRGSSSSGQTGIWWQHPASAGITISIPIFSGGKINSQANQTKIAMKQLQMQKEYLEESTTLEVQTAISNLFTARGTMMANDKAVLQAQKAYDITNVRYNGGAGTILELSNAQLQLTQARLNYTQAIYDYLAAQADYDKLIGVEYQIQPEE